MELENYLREEWLNNCLKYIKQLKLMYKNKIYKISQVLTILEVETNQQEWTSFKNNDNNDNNNT
jgi:hypothetical protein